LFNHRYFRVYNNNRNNNNIFKTVSRGLKTALTLGETIAAGETIGAAGRGRDDEELVDVKKKN